MSGRDYRTLMMMISDNTATDMIVDLLRKENINETMRRLRLRKTTIMICREILFALARLGDIPPEERTIEIFNERIQRRTYQGLRKINTEWGNVSTPRDLTLLLEKIYKGEVSSRSSCDEIIALMKRCQTGANRIWKYLPRREVEVAHKTGSVRHVVNYVGIVFPKEKEPYILCCFTKGLSTNSEGEEVIAKVSKIVYEHFTT